MNQETPFDCFERWKGGLMSTIGVVYDHNGRRTIYPDKPSVIIKFKTPEALMEYMLSLETERRIISKDEMSFSQHVWLYKGLIFNHKSNRVIKVLVSEHK